MTIANFANRMRFRAPSLLIGLAVSLTMQATAKADDLLLFGGVGHKEFLGCLNCSEFVGNSIWNEMSTYGWKNGFGTWNSLGSYKNSFSSYSACNEFASDPPVIVDAKGAYYGRLSINEIRTDSVCNSINNADALCRALKVMCATD
jgi:hypothetical protein